MSSDNTTAPDRQTDAIQQLVRHYVGQLCDGCGSTMCKESMCDTGRRNSAPPNRNVRKWTPRSARTIAIALASGPAPRKHLCQYWAENSPARDGLEGADGPHDPSSFAQLLSDMPTIRRLFSSTEHPPASPTAYQSLSRSLNLLLHGQALRVDTVVSNERTADLLCAALTCLLADLPSGTAAQWAYVDFFISRGCAYPDRTVDVPTDHRWNVWLPILDHLERVDAVHLLSKIARVVAARTKTEDVLADFKRKLGMPDTNARSARRLLQLLVDKIPHILANPLWLIVWLKKIVLLHWDGVSTAVTRGSVACGSLELLEMLYTRVRRGLISANSIPIIVQSLDAISLAEGWLQHCNRADLRHLLTFKFLFGPLPRSMYFRTISHLKMRQATSLAEKAVTLRRRMMPRMLEGERSSQLRYTEEHYLLLSVSRSNVLRDAYDQLWQRRHSELFRPLRVRLGEVDDLEVGHDLGGVQMEFFNLVCKRVFAEEAQMFTTDPKTGLSYFRPGSLQPLYMFELFGLLMALALYNGITLPVNLPNAFYAVLLTPESHLRRDGLKAYNCVGTQFLRDGWPVEKRSLDAMLDEDAMDLEWSFPLEANGLRLSVRWHEDNNQLDVISATSEGGQNVDLSDGMEWPGWHLVKSPDEPATITDDNKKEYVLEYVQWLVWQSVKPQFEAFRKGFSRVIDRHMISLFPPESFVAFVQGVSRLDINELRSATRYEGYDPNGRYIQTFWRVVGSWSERKQKQLLKFVTAAERIPIGGTSNLTFVIQRNVVEDAERLPTSSTCFGTLQLPRYPSAEVLDKKLSLAIKYGLEGFGTG